MMTPSSLTVLGMMSGTSLDGLDLCLSTFYREKEQWRFDIQALRTLLNQIEALALVNGEADYLPLIKDLNVISERYKNLLARKHHTAKPDKKAAEE